MATTGITTIDGEARFPITLSAFSEQPE